MSSLRYNEVLEETNEGKAQALQKTLFPISLI